jgi:hypothetical protein
MVIGSGADVPEVPADSILKIDFKYESSWYH